MTVNSETPPWSATTAVSVQPVLEGRGPVGVGEVRVVHSQLHASTLAAPSTAATRRARSGASPTIGAMVKRLSGVVAALVLVLGLAACVRRGRRRRHRRRRPTPTAADAATHDAQPTRRPTARPCDLRPTRRQRTAGRPEVDPPAADRGVRRHRSTHPRDQRRATSASTLDAATAPCTVNSFTSLASQGYYDDTPCHRLTTDGHLRAAVRRPDRHRHRRARLLLRRRAAAAPRPTRPARSRWPTPGPTPTARSSSSSTTTRRCRRLHRLRHRRRRRARDAERASPRPAPPRRRRRRPAEDGHDRLRRDRRGDRGRPRPSRPSPGERGHLHLHRRRVSG